MVDGAGVRPRVRAEAPNAIRALRAEEHWARGERRSGPRWQRVVPVVAAKPARDTCVRAGGREPDRGAAEGVSGPHGALDRYIVLVPQRAAARVLGSARGAARLIAASSVTASLG